MYIICAVEEMKLPRVKQFTTNVYAGIKSGA